MSATESKHVRRVAQGIAIDLDLCKACGICRNLCPRDVFDLDERGYPIVSRLDQCTVCMICEYHCPDFAISVSYSEVTYERPSDGRPTTEQSAAAVSAEAQVAPKSAAAAKRRAPSRATTTKRKA